LEAKLDDIAKSNSGAATSGIQFESRTIYIKINCAKCDIEYQKLHTELMAGGIARIEVVFSGSSNVDMINWAKSQSVSPELNKRGVIVLRGIENDEKVSNFPTVRIDSI
jgi:hypothetical protein